MSDVFTIGGSTVSMDSEDCVPVRFHEEFGAIPTLTIQRRGVALEALPDPWVGQAVTWTHGGTNYFTGDVVSANPHFDESLGWVVTYQCLGWLNRLDWISHTDSATGTQTSAFNLLLTDPSYNATRTGRSVGQILTSVLQMSANAAACTALGIGNYTIAMGTYTLPSVTSTDLAALTVVPPRPVYFGGEKLAGALQGFVAQWAPNSRMWIDPSGNFRFLDLRTFSSHTFTMGTDPIEPAELARDVGNCFQRVVVTGQPIAVMALLKQSLGQLTEAFPWGSYATNAAAIAAWTPSQFTVPGTALSQGTCTCPSTTTITLTSSSGSENWVAGYWDQSHQQGTINLYASTLGTSYVQCWSARIVTCPSLTAGGTCTVIIDNPLPNTSYDHYTITGLATGGSVVWTQYAVANAALWPLVTNQSTYPQAFVNASGTGATVLSGPLGIIFRPDGSTFPLAFTFNSATGNLRFLAPTYIVANNAAPADVWVYLPINTNPNTAIYPPNTGMGGTTPAYAGTSSSVDGLEKTLPVMIDVWTDPGQYSSILAYATDLLDSVKDAVVEGSLTYYGFFPSGLTFGLAATVVGNDGAGSYATPWSGLSLAIRGVDVEWPQGSGQDYITRLTVSNRRGVYDSAQFLKPPRRAGYGFGVAAGLFHPFPVAGGPAAGGLPAALDLAAELRDGFGLGDEDGDGEGHG